jgi:hypothetical protein
MRLFRSMQSGALAGENDGAGCAQEPVKLHVAEH